MADRHRSKQINKMNSITSYEATKAVVRRDTEEVQSKGNFDVFEEVIAQQIKGRGYCVVFDHDLERCWPRNKMARAERETKIQGFAESQGWNATILENGFGAMAIFRRLEPGAADYEGSSVVPR